MGVSTKFPSNDYQMFYLIQLPNGNCSYVYTDNEGNFVLQENSKINDEEVPYYVNDFYYAVPDDTSIVGDSSFISTEWSSSGVNNSFNHLLI
jgi:hypothetical protein